MLVSKKILTQQLLDVVGLLWLHPTGRFDKWNADNPDMVVPWLQVVAPC